MSKTCIINQPAGLGDILFCQKIGYHYYNLGYKITWPIDNAYFLDVKNYINCPFNYVPKMNHYSKEPIFTDNYVYLPLDGCSTITHDLVMTSKMKIAKVEYNKDWHNYLFINRNLIKEKQLYYDILKLKDNDKYVLTNYNFASPPNIYRQSTRYNGNLQEVEISFKEGFSLFDWLLVINNATEIFVTDSSTTMLIEWLKSNKTEKYTVITRQGNFDELSCMYNLPWNFIKGNIQL